ncbi:helix-turn-helix domain-containing protein [Enterocloster lavalensis]|uniref:helix-turn-helix domain-containing protein n=1 Tax=Enterocloster lavalensis TaxID=460384 RepID=UPI0034A27B4A
MGLYENIRDIAKINGYSVNRLEQELGFARSSINKFNKNTPSVEKLQQIANKLNVTVDDLMKERGLTTCQECGLMYDSSHPDDIKTHYKQHSAWLKAVEKFGELYCYYPEREKIKAENRNISHNVSLPINKRMEAQIKVLHCLFSRSVESNRYDLRHVPFDTYVAMMLGNKSYRKNLEDDLFQALSNKYGTMPGISNGTVYNIPESKISTITKKDERDIKKDLESLREKLASKELGPAAFDGEDIPEDDTDLFLGQVELMLRRLKAKNKEKYTPDKYKK